MGYVSKICFNRPIGSLAIVSRQFDSLYSTYKCNFVLIIMIIERLTSFVIFVRCHHMSLILRIVESCNEARILTECISVI